MTPGVPLGDSTGGSVFQDVCGNDEVVAGVQLGFNEYLDQVSAICQKYTLQVEQSAVPYRYQVSLAPGSTLPAHPTTTTDSLQLLSCQAGSVLVGLNVDQQPWDSPPDTFIVITRVSAVCAEPLIDVSGSAPHLRWLNPSSVGPIAGSGFTASAATNKTDLLAADRLAVGFLGASGAWIDQIGMASSSIEVLLH